MEATIDKNVNYIISGLERSGTSMLMQILFAANLPVSFDDSRPPDPNNPKGYFELEGGKIINKLMNNTFPFKNFLGTFIKITAYGLKFLPMGNYKIIYSERNIEEILDSMEKMAQIKDYEREDTKTSFLHLNNMIKKTIKDRDDCQVLYANYNNIISDSEKSIMEICDFLNLSSEYSSAMINSIDNKLYRQRRTI
jgi:hypothetical protein